MPEDRNDDNTSVLMMDSGEEKEERETMETI